ncbi:MAG: cohesin domain-containing protein [Clostridiales bacterium]|nr:cohesin domain-containing protein [Clostridiales bacterium]
MKKKHILIALLLLLILAVATRALAQDYFKTFFKAQDLAVLEKSNRLATSEAEYRDYVSSAYDDLKIYLDLDKEDLDNLIKLEGLPSDKHDLLQIKLTDEFVALTNSNLTEEEKLSRIIEILFKLQEMNMLDTRNYDFNFLLADNQNLTPRLQYFLDNSELKRTSQRYSEKHTRIIRPFVTKVQILGDTAKIFASIEEIALHEDGSLPGGSITKYEIDFIMIDNNWFISEMRSDDFMETYYINNNIKIDIEATIKMWMDERLEAQQRQKDIEAGIIEIIDYDKIIEDLMKLKDENPEEYKKQLEKEAAQKEKNEGSRMNLPTITVASQIGEVGDIVEIPICITNNPGIISMLFDIGFDDNALKFIGYTDTGMLNSPSHRPQNQEGASSPLRFCWIDALAGSNNEANGDILVLRFEILGIALPDDYGLDLTYTVGNIIDTALTQVDFIVEPGIITVIEIISE